MRLKPVTMVLIGLMILSVLLAGCRRSAVPPVEELAPEEEAAAMMQEAQENTEELDEATPEATEEPASEPAEAETETPEPTEEVAEPTATPEPVTVVDPTATPELLEQPTETVAPGAAATYVVKPGDNLFRIALNNGVTLQALSQANNITNPALIYVGQELVIPAGGATAPTTPLEGQTCSSVYVVQPGDNLFRIALRHGYSQMYLAQVNGIANPSLVYVGQQICIP